MKETKPSDGSSNEQFSVKQQEPVAEGSSVKRELEKKVEEGPPLKKNRNPSTISISSEDLHKKEGGFNSADMTSDFDFLQ